jgi:2-methylcitrate dehydratase PrpD
MTGTVVERLAGFTAQCRFEDLPPEFANETKRVLDSIGCALAATNEPKGRIGTEIAA